MKTILTTLREQGKTGATIAKALGGGTTIAAAIAKSSAKSEGQQ